MKTEQSATSVSVLVIFVLVFLATRCQSINENGFRTLLSEADNSVMPKMLENIENAKAVGAVNTSSIENLTKQAAGLHLLSEVVTVAGNQLSSLSPEFNNLLFSGKISGKHLQKAFDHAKRAGLPAEEIIAAKSIIKNTIQTRISQKTTDTSTWTTSAAVEFAMLVHCGSMAWVDEAVLVEARAKLLDALQGPFTRENIQFIEALLPHADHAGVNVPRNMQDWPRSLGRLRDLVQISGCNQNSIKNIRDALYSVRELGLGNAAEINDAEVKLGDCGQVAFSAEATSKRDDENNVVYIDRLLSLLESKNQMSVNASLVTAVQAMVTSAVNAELGSVLALDVTMAPKKMRAAVDIAKKVGMSAEAASVASTMVAKVKAALEAATANSQNAGRRLSSDGRCQTAKSLALAINAAHATGYKEKNGEMSTALALFQALAGDPSLGADDFPYIECLSKWCDMALCQIPSRIVSWIQAAEVVRSAMSVPAASPGSCEIYRQASARGRAAALPPIEENSQVQLLARTCSQALADATASQQGGDLEDLLRAIKDNLDNGGSSGEMAVAVEKARILAKSKMDLLVQAGDTARYNEFDNVINQASRAGVDAAEISAARAALHSVCQAQIAAAVVAVQTLPRSSDNVLALTLLVKRCLRMKYPEELVGGARGAVNELFAGTFTGQDLDYLYDITAFADHAMVTPPRWAAEWRLAYHKLKDASEYNLGNPEMLKIAIKALQHAESLEMPFGTVASSLKGLVRVRVEAAVTSDFEGPPAHVLQNALSMAVQAGVSASDLESSRTVQRAI